MNAPTIGSLFSGAGALCELALAPLLGGRVVWHCEYEPPTKKTPKPRQAAARVLAHRFPGTPNLGDITAVDWAAVEPVEVLAGGFPCTDVSSAGQRVGLRPDTRSGLWSHMAYAISVLRPRLVVIENVRGLASAPAHSEMEPCSWCLGDGPDQHALRALGAVLGDLADLGYDAVWCGLRASDVGACHARFRFVVLAAPADTRCLPGIARRLAAPGQAAGGRAFGEPSGRCGARTLLPAPRATDGVKGGPNQRGSSGDLMLPSVVAKLLPTPTGNDARGSRNLTANRRAPKPTTATTGSTLSDAVWLLPTPTVADGAGGHASRGGLRSSELLLPGVAKSASAASEVDWGVYEPAIRRHERWLGRPVPHPTIKGARGGKKLNPQLSEWMMGWPAGWVTDVPGLTPNDTLQVCGNGVVPQQMVAAIENLLPLVSEGVV